MYSEYNPTDYYYVVSIDVGVKNLGISFSEINKDFTLSQIIWFDCIDITTFIHLDEESRKECKLYHEKTYCDYLEHVFYLYKELFSVVDYVLVERQPPQGYVVIEQLIFSKFRDKTILISPNSMHAFFNFGKEIDYEKRKYYTEQIAERCLKKNKSRNYLLIEFHNLYRKHDVGDSICMIIFWLSKKHKVWKTQEEKKRYNHYNLTCKDLDYYRYYESKD